MSALRGSFSVAAMLLALAAGAGGQGAPQAPAFAAVESVSAAPAEAVRTFAEEAAVLASGRLSARRKALARLAVHRDAEADKLLLAQFDRFLAGEMPPAIWLDFFEAAAKREHPELRARLAHREQKLTQSRDALSRFRECLEGGDGETGRAIFHTKPEAGCIRCHTVSGEGGKIGPDLTWLRNSIDRALILESIITPNSSIATGFASVALTLKNGETVSGVVSHESPEEITVTSVADGKQTRVKTAEVAERMALPSPMPPHFGVVLDKRAIRDLVEFIAVGD